MIIESVSQVFFSPTGTTEAVVDAITRGIGCGAVRTISLTRPDPGGVFTPIGDGVAVIGAPVYCGRVAPEAARRLRRVTASGTPAVVVAVYGNREYQDALRELRDLAAGLGFRPVAGGAFVGEHSFHREEAPIAAGRPDGRDLREAERFGSLVRARIGAARSADDLPSPEVPGGFPYVAWTLDPGFAPVTATGRCDRCGTCASVCPTAAISVGDEVTTNGDVCILCSACIKRCPRRGRSWQTAWVLDVAARLSARCSQRKEPELFL